MEQIKLHLFNGKIIILLITFKDKKNVKRLFMKKIDILLQYKKKLQQTQDTRQYLLFNASCVCRRIIIWYVHY